MMGCFMTFTKKEIITITKNSRPKSWMKDCMETPYFLKQVIRHIIYISFLEKIGFEALQIALRPAEVWCSPFLAGSVS